MLRAAAAAVLLASAATGSAREHDAPERSSAGAEPVAAPFAARPDARLGLRLGPLLAPAEGASDAVAVQARPAAPAPCPVDWCQPRVDVPGLELARARISRPELVATLLDSADLAPLASLVWVLARTGLELDWRPAQLDASPGASASGRGIVMLWLKLRMDAWGRPSFPAPSAPARNVNAPRA